MLFIMPALFKSVMSNNSRIIIKNTFRAFSSNAELPVLETLAVSVPKKHVYHVELNRPKKMNSFNDAMWLELSKCFEALSNHSECRVIVLSAQGKHFTAGLDFNSLMSLNQKAEEFDDIARKARYLHGIIGQCQGGITALEKCVKPVLSLVHSACVGAGVDLITAADMRYCTEDAWFQVKEVEIGLAADVGTLQRLPKVIGNASIARELCFTARKFDAKEAKEIGLVSKVFKDKESGLAEVLNIAENIAAKSPVAVQVTKQSLVYSQDRTTDAGLEHIKLINQVMLQSEDLAKSAMAQATKSGTPEFEDL